MAYNPGIQYRGDQHLAAGFESLNQQWTQAMEKYAENSKKAKSLRQALKLYAPSVGVEGKALAAGLDSMNLPELEGAMIGLSQYAAQMQAVERLRHADEESERRAAHDEAMRTYYDEGRKLQARQQDRADEAARVAAEWQSNMGEYASAYGMDEESIRAAVAYANRWSPGGMPNQVAGDMLNPSKPRPEWVPKVVDAGNGVRALTTSPNSAVMVPAEGAGSVAVDRLKLSAIQKRISALQSQAATEFADPLRRRQLQQELDKAMGEMMALVGMPDATPAPAPEPDSRKYKIEVVK